MAKEGEKTKLCLLRDIFRVIKDFEIEFQKKHDLCLNEGMTLCSLRNEKMSSSDLAQRLGLSTSNMSKVIKAVESKGLVERILGDEDKRQMYFVLTAEGAKKLDVLKCEEESLSLVLESIYETKNMQVASMP